MIKNPDQFTPSAADKIVEFLSTRIRKREMEPGAKLPTEQALARQFSVSRPVVREAISRIKADGLAHSRQGSGLYVAGPLERRSFKIEENLGDNIAGLMQLLELRLPLEMSMARLAAARRTTADMERLEAAHAALIASETGGQSGVQADLTFHHAIALASQNIHYADIAAYLGRVLHDAMQGMYKRSNQPGMKEATLDEHARILRAIRDRDPEAAGLAVMIHLENARNWLLLNHPNPTKNL